MDPDDVVLDEAMAPGVPGPSRGTTLGTETPFGGFAQRMGSPPAQYKKWAALYPIYIDAKRAHGRGGRRVSKDAAVQWPLAAKMAQMCLRLGIQAIIEADKAHPMDWENPGRVRVNLEGRRVRKSELLHKISRMLQQDAAREGTGDKGIAAHYPVQYSPAVSHGVLALTLDEAEKAKKDAPEPEKKPAPNKPKVLKIKGKRR